MLLLTAALMVRHPCARNAIHTARPDDLRVVGIPRCQASASPSVGMYDPAVVANVFSATSRWAVSRSAAVTGMKNHLCGSIAIESASSMPARRAPHRLEQHRRAAVAGVHVEPYLFFPTECCDIGERIERARRRRARRRDHGERGRALL